MSPYGLGLSELAFWLLTPREFAALKIEWDRGHHVTPPLTKEQQENLDRGRRHILERQIAARNRQAQRGGIRPQKIPVRVN